MGPQLDGGEPMKVSRIGLLGLLVALASVTPGYAQPAPSTPPPFSVMAPVSATLAVTVASARVQLPNSLAQFPLVSIINDGATEVFVSIGGATVTATACGSTTGTCASLPVPAGQTISGFVGAGYVAAITGTATSTVRLIQYNGHP